MPLKAEVAALVVKAEKKEILTKCRLETNDKVSGGCGDLRGKKRRGWWTTRQSEEPSPPVRPKTPRVLRAPGAQNLPTRQDELSGSEALTLRRNAHSDANHTYICTLTTKQADN